MVDVTSLVLLAASFFFVALSVALLVRYRQVSERVNVSTDLGRELWAALEQRLKKQDERILDMMGRVEVIQARVTAGTAVSGPPSVAVPHSASQPGSEPFAGHIPSEAVQQEVSQVSQISPAPQTPVAGSRPISDLDQTQLAALRLLGESPRNTRQLTDALGKSREHTARIMKGLFEAGLVRRNDSSKPFVYELTDDGRRRLSGV